MKKQGSAAVEDLEVKVTTLESRSKQAAQRDLDVSQALDNLTEHRDAEERNGPRLPSSLKELFLPMRTGESPVSIYGTFVENYTQFNGKPGAFSSPAFAPYFFLNLNSQILLADNITITNTPASVRAAQIICFATDS